MIKFIINFNTIKCGWRVGVILLLVDFNNLFYKAMNVNIGLTSTRTGVPIFGAFGFLKQFCETIHDVRPSHVIVCGDAKPYIRSTLFPRYKEKRREVDADKYAITKYNKEICDAILATLGLSVHLVKGFEADDLIASAVSKYRYEAEKIIIASTDSDLVQLLKFRRVYIRKKYRGKLTNYGREQFLEEYDGMTTEQYVLMQAISGTHNSVPGIKNYGKVKAMKVVKDDALCLELYKKHSKEIDLYIKLIKLPIQNCDSKSLTARSCRYSEREMIRVLAREGIELTKRMHDAFEFIGG